MALTRPSLYTIAAFDASQAQTFRFNVIGGDTVTGSTLTIKNNATLAVVATNTVETYKLENTLPANKLTNGTYYQATIKTKNAAGQESEESAPIQFWCYTTPSMVFTNIPNTGVIVNSSYDFQVTYNQAQNEPLAQYTFNLYTPTGTLVGTSGVKYTNSTTVPLNIDYIFSGLEDGALYNIECVGVTSEGTQVTTVRRAFSVAYDAPTVYSNLQLTNNCMGGYIQIELHVIGIGGTSNPENPTYIDNKKIDMRGDGNYVRWDDGFELTSNYTLGLWGENLTPGADTLIMLNNNGDSVNAVYMENDTNAWFELYVSSASHPFKYQIISNLIAKPDDVDEIFMTLRCVDNLYDITIKNRGVIV